MCKLCKKRAPKATVLNKNVLECKFDSEFDYIYMEAMIHNFPLSEAVKVLDLASKWLKETGILICTTTVECQDSEGYEKKEDYNEKVKRFRHRYTDKTFDELIKSNFVIVDKKYKREKDEIRDKLWQIIYAKKR